jgi:uncharacterized protein (TIGR00730 family)
MREDTTRFGQPDAVPLSDEDAAATLLQSSVMGLWEVVNQLTRLRRSRRSNYRVSIFGSARIAPDTPAYQQVTKLAAELTRMGCDVITGGGPGLMQAANEGAASTGAGRREGSVGIRITLPFEQNVNPFVRDPHEHQTFFSRLHHFALLSDAFVVVPGGIGTLLELSMAWQLLQVRQLLDVPLILVGEMWPELIAWTRKTMLREGIELASAPDLDIPRCTAGVEDTVALIRASREQWLLAQSASQPRSR